MDDVTCPACGTLNTADADDCSNCTRSLIVGKLTSIGMGVLPKGYIWEMRPIEQTLGRNIANTFVIPSNLIAGEQLRFAYKNGEFHLIDRENKGRCLVGGNPVKSETLLRNGATIKVGVEEFLFNYVTEETESESEKADPLATHLQLMLAVVSEFHASLNLQEVFNNAVDAVIRLTHTRRGYAFLLDEGEEGDVELREVCSRRSGGRPLDDTSGSYTISQSIVERVVGGDESVIIEDAGAQQVSTETIRRFKLNSIVCLPLVTFNTRTGRKRVMGVIYADSSMPTGELPKHARPTLQMLTQILTSTIVKWQNYEKMEAAFKNFEHSLDSVHKDMDMVAEDLKILDEQLRDPDSVTRIPREQISTEIQAVNARIMTVQTSLRRLQYPRR